MKEQWKFDEYAKVLSKVEGDRSPPVQVDLSYESYVQSNNNYSNRILIILRILILVACLALLSWLSIKLYSEYTTFPSFSKYPFQDQTRVSEIIVDEDPIEYHDWRQTVDGDDSFTVTYGNNDIRTKVDEDDYETIKFITPDNHHNKLNERKFQEDKQNFTRRLTPNLAGIRKKELDMAVRGTFVMIKSLDILKKYGLELTRDQWICELLKNETEKSRINILKFIELTKPYHSDLEENMNCTKVSDGKRNSTEENTSTSNFFTNISVIIDVEVNILLAKHLEPLVGDFFKLLLWYFDNRNSQYYKNNENDLKVLTTKILFDTDIVGYRKNLDHLQSIIEHDKEYQNDYEKLLNGTLTNLVPNTQFQNIIISRLDIKTAAERLYAYDIINAETLKYVLPVVDEICRDDYNSNNGIQNNNDTNIITKITKITDNVN